MEVALLAFLLCVFVAVYFYEENKQSIKRAEKLQRLRDEFIESINDLDKDEHVESSRDIES